jgi:uncharacterized membrane protein
MTISRLAMATAVAVSIALPAFAATSLSPDEIKATFGTGSPIAGRTPGGMTYTLTLGSDGSAQMVLLKGQKTTSTGTWHVSKDGYCSKWATNPERCYTVAKNGKHYDVTNAAGNVIASWTM